METAIDVVVFGVGAAMVAAALGSAVRTVVLPRGVPARLASFSTRSSTGWPPMAS